MRVQCLAILAAASLIGADDPKNDPAKKDLKKLAGTWVAESVVIDGKKMNDPNESTTFIIKDGNLSWTYEKRTGDAGEESTIGFTFKLNPGKQPAEIDLVPTEGTFKGSVFPSIYLIDGDTLKVCRSQPDTKRPTKFASEKGDNHWLLVLKRGKS